MVADLNGRSSQGCLKRPRGDLHQCLKEKGALNPTTAINFAIDIARKRVKFTSADSGCDETIHLSNHSDEGRTLGNHSRKQCVVRM
ncbi:hypothetical protein L1987_43787 [Smallanthus sonchifolius]|uniref:Uncharacterized protein n=1 Tax=Smallanthus sonchifolius TaxID=185202 RepID=A0ACB9GMK6_9ASTR|nr:hypothetical protein L1987_43787 [Smallanthus sonchifolius]